MQLVLGLRYDAATVPLTPPPPDNFAQPVGFVKAIPEIVNRIIRLPRKQRFLAVRDPPHGFHTHTHTHTSIKSIND